MRRSLLVLLFPSLLWAQGLPIDKILKPETSPSERVRLLDQIAKTESGAADLASRGLNPDLDPEVLHAVAAALFEHEHAEKHIEPIIRLLLGENEILRNKIQRRIHEYDAKKLLGPLGDAALGRSAAASKNVGLRVAAIRALCKVTHRKAIEDIVEAWGSDKDDAVKKECKLALAPVLVARNPAEAREYLEKRRHDTYYDLLIAMNTHLRARNAELRKYQKEALRRADAKSLLTFLVDADADAREALAERALDLAKKGEYGDLDAEKYANGIFDILLFESKREDADPEVVAYLVQTMGVLASGGDKAPFKKHNELLGALRPLAQAPKGWDAVGTACIDLLKGLGEAASGPLVDFARDAKSTEVRRQAIGALGSLARQDANTQNYIGTQLAQLLQREQSPEVRQQILFTLKSAPVDSAHAPIKSLLKPADPKAQKPLTKSELNYCIQILRLLGPEALLTLLDLARTHPEPEVRLHVVREGLIRRDNKPEDVEAIESLLKTILTNKKETAELRAGVITALGEHGGRDAYGTLHHVALDPEHKDAVAEAKLRLAQRIAERKKGEPLVAEDIQTALQILKESPKADVGRLTQIVYTLIAAADARKLPAGAARWMRAQLQARLPEAKPEETLRLYKEAAQKAQADGLNPEVEEQMLLQFREVLEKAPGADDVELVACSRRLAKLAEKKPQLRARYLLDAADYAARKVKNREMAEMVLQELEGVGPLEGAQASRLASIRKDVEALPTKGS